MCGLGYLRKSGLERYGETKMKHQKLVDRINNRHNEKLPGPLFWIGVLCVMVLLTSGAMG